MPNYCFDNGGSRIDSDRVPMIIRNMTTECRGCARSFHKVCDSFNIRWFGYAREY